MLDIGALDETAYKVKRHDGSWLHLALAGVAQEVIGIDNSALIPADGLETSRNSRILRMGVESLDQVPGRDSYDVIVAGELIEHLPNAQTFLETVRGAGFRTGCELLLTTPNATAFHNVILALGKRESMHKDHVAIFSYKTLATLCVRAGFLSWQLIPYYVRFSEMLGASRGPTRTGVLLGERVCNAASWVFPMLAAGWILRVRL